jgi:flagellar capping protein FliD
LQEALGMLTDEERLILGTKKFSTIVSKTNRSIDRQIKALDKEIEKKRKLYNKAIVQLDKEMAKLENEVSEYNNNNLNKEPKVCYKRAE